MLPISKITQNKIALDYSAKLFHCWAQPIRALPEEEMVTLELIPENEDQKLLKNLKSSAA